MALREGAGAVFVCPRIKGTRGVGVQFLYRNKTPGPKERGMIAMPVTMPKLVTGAAKKQSGSQP